VVEVGVGVEDRNHWVWGLADEILQAQDRHYDGIRNKPRTAHQSNRASSLGHPCMRYLVLCRTEGHRQSKVGRRLQALFDEGQRNEPMTKSLMSQWGFDFWGGDQVSWPANNWEIGGRVDGIYPRGSEAVIVELKRVNDHTFSRINHYEDFIEAPDSYFYKWYCQLILYILLAQSSEQFKIDYGLFILSANSDRWIKPIAVPMNWELAELLVGKADSVNQHIADGTLPDYCAKRSVCKRCPFYGDVCNPPMDFGPGVSLVTDEWAAGRFAELAKLAKDGPEYVALDKWARNYVKDLVGFNDKTVMIGPTMAEVTVVPTRTGISRRVKFTHTEA
jgi:hypothetical protein